MKENKSFFYLWISDRNFFTASHLKILACIFMLISHMGQTGYVYFLGHPEYYYPFMLIGRLAFPIFCFFIVQGVILTSDLKKYLLRLLIFALVSEIPFDLAFSFGIDYNKQNVFFTLFFGAFCVGIIDIISKKNYNLVFKFIINLSVLLLFMYLSFVLKTDYSYKGVLAIFLIYIGRYSKLFTILAILIGFYFEAYLYGVVYLSIILIILYNGKKGKMNKWFFYLFYPCHLLIIYYLMSYITIN